MTITTIDMLSVYEAAHRYWVHQVRERDGEPPFAFVVRGGGTEFFSGHKTLESAECRARLLNARGAMDAAIQVLEHRAFDSSPLAIQLRAVRAELARQAAKE